MKLTDVRSLHSFNHFRSHAGVHLYRCNVFRLLENFHSQVSGTGADFHDLVCWFEIRLKMKKPEWSTDQVILWLRNGYSKHGR
jgi:hypothetical protein